MQSIPMLEGVPVGPAGLDQFPQLLARLPAGLDLDALALKHGAIRRKRELRSGTALARLALARGPGGLTLQESAAWAGLLGLAAMSGEAVRGRLNRAADFLEALVREVLEGWAQEAGLCWRGRALRLSDSTSLTAPGGKGTDWRVHAVFDLGRGGFSEFQVTDDKGAESLQRGAAVAGEVRIADRGFAHAAAMQGFLASGGGAADFILRLGWNALRLRQPDGQPFDLIAWLQALPEGDTPHEVLARAEVNGRRPLPLRLVVRRKPPEAAAAARAQLLATARRKQKQPHPNSLTAAGFLILATSLPAEGFPAAEVLAVYRLRWQIELAFKRLKSLLHLDRLPTRGKDSSRSWILSHLLLALLCDAASEAFLAASPEPLLTSTATPSLYRAQKVIARSFLALVFGPITLDRILNANADFHQRLANPRRRRQPAWRYPTRPHAA